MIDVTMQAAADRHRIEHHGGAKGCALPGKEDGREHHGGDQCHRIGFKQISRHAGTVTDIVADVIGDCCGVAWIIFRNTSLDLADEISANVSAFGEDAAAKAGENRNQRSTEAQCHQSESMTMRLFGCSGPACRISHAVVDRDTQQCQARHQHAGDRTGLEGDIKTTGQRGGGSLCRAHIGADRHIHAD